MAVPHPSLALSLRPWREGDQKQLAAIAGDFRVAMNLRDLFPHPYSEVDADWWVANNTVQSWVAAIEAKWVADSESDAKLIAQEEARRKSYAALKAATSAAASAAAATASAPAAAPAPPELIPYCLSASTIKQYPLSPLYSRFALAICVSDVVIGSIGLFGQSAEVRHVAECGYWMGVQWWGQGIGSAVLKAFVKLAWAQFPQLIRIEAGNSSDSKDSFVYFAFC